jgi:hypothetical protein
MIHEKDSKWHIQWIHDYSDGYAFGIDFINDKEDEHEIYLRIYIGTYIFKIGKYVKYGE